MIFLFLHSPMVFFFFISFRCCFNLIQVRIQMILSVSVSFCSVILFFFFFCCFCHFLYRIWRAMKCWKQPIILWSHKKKKFLPIHNFSLFISLIFVITLMERCILSDSFFYFVLFSKKKKIHFIGWPGKPLRIEINFYLISNSNPLKKNTFTIWNGCEPYFIFFYFYFRFYSFLLFHFTIHLNDYQFKYVLLIKYFSIRFVQCLLSMRDTLLTMALNEKDNYANHRLVINDQNIKKKLPSKTATKYFKLLKRKEAKKKKTKIRNKIEKTFRRLMFCAVNFQFTRNGPFRSYRCNRLVMTALKHIEIHRFQCGSGLETNAMKIILVWNRTSAYQCFIFFFSFNVKEFTS